MRWNPSSRKRDAIDSESVSVNISLSLAAPFLLVSSPISVDINNVMCSFICETGDILQKTKQREAAFAKKRRARNPWGSFIWCCIYSSSKSQILQGSCCALEPHTAVRVSDGDSTTRHLCPCAVAPIDKGLVHITQAFREQVLAQWESTFCTGRRSQIRTLASSHSTWLDWWL